jgi:hypothetical protein
VALAQPARLAVLVEALLTVLADRLQEPKARFESLVLRDDQRLRRRCPANNVTGGKRRKAKTNQGNRWLGEILNQWAWTSARTRGTYLSAQFWRFAKRKRTKKAAVAVSHSILAIAWHILADGSTYHDLGGDYFAKRDTERTRQRAVEQLRALGYTVTLEPAAA